MKKMMMALAIALATVVGNAASVNWNSGTLSSSLAGYPTDWVGKTMSFFLVGSASYDESSVITAMQNGGAAALPAGADLAKAIQGAPFNMASGTGATTSFADGQVAYGYAVVFNVAGDKFAISKVGTSAVFASGANASLNLGGAANFTVYSVVPEPTSMALLALGAAAIGLRRRFRK